MGEQSVLEGVTLHKITPRVSDWLPDFLDRLYPVSVQAVRRHIGHQQPGVLTDKRLQTTITTTLQEDVFDLDVEQEWSATTDLWSDADAEVSRYAQRLAELVYLTEEVEDLDDLPDPVVDDVTSIGTSQGPFNAGLEALAAGPAQLHQQVSEEPPVITISFDGAAWMDLEDRQTGLRSLAALAILGSAFDIRLIISPSVDRLLERRYQDWYRAHLSLTEPRETSGGSTPTTDEDESAQVLQEAWEVLTDLPEKTKKARLLHHLDPDDPREFRALARDDEIDLASGSIEPYVDDLEDLGLVQKHTDRRYNAVSLSSLGAVAVRELVTPDGSFVHPSQSRLETRLTPTPQPEGSTVYRARWDTGGGKEASPAVDQTQSSSPEAHLASTGEAGVDSAYVQWLDGPGGRLDAYSMHNRYMAGRRSPGVTLVDDRIERFEDGRVTYLSCFEDDLLVLAQWGGGLPTLGRIAGALLSNKALSKILTIDALGEEFEQIDDGVVEQLDQDIEDIICWGHQIGWFSEDERTYDGWKDRFVAVKSLCLEKVAELSGGDDYDARGELMKDLHGLITSLTHLYYAIGVDVTINLRVPDMKMLLEEDRRLEDFLKFLQYSVPKQTVYGIHSGYRTVIEDRVKKLRRRLPYEVDASDPQVMFTASWILSGPTMTDLQQEIDQALQEEQAREEIREGEVEAPAIEIPVMNGNSYKAVKETVRQQFKDKNYRVAEEDDFSPRQEQELRRLARVFIRTLGTEDRPHQANPHDIVEAIQYIAQSTKPGDYASVADVEYGLSQLSVSRLMPDLPPSATAIWRTILNADNPIGRSEIIDRADISGSSYDRYINELAIMDVIEARQVDGHRRWVGSIEAWWSPQVPDDEPPVPVIEDDDLVWVSENPRPEVIVSQLVLRIAKVFGNEDLLKRWFEESWPHEEIEEFLRSSRRLSRWWPYIWGAIASEEDLYRGPPGVRHDPDVRVARIGAISGEVMESQVRLKEISASDPTRPATADPGLGRGVR